MAEKPTYEELEQRINDFEKKAEKRKQAEAALYESEKKFRSMVETISDLIWEVNQNNVYTYVNPQVKDELGYSPEEMLGKSVFDFMSEDEVKTVTELNKSAVEHRKPIVMLEATAVHKKGHLVVLESNGTPIISKNGDYQGYRGVSRNTTTKKKIEEELRVSNDKFSAIFRFSPNAITISRLEDRRIIDACKSYCHTRQY